MLLAAALLAGAAAVLSTAGLPTAPASGVAAVVVAMGGALMAYGTDALKKHKDRRELLPSVVRLDARGRLPLVRALDDPVVLGVHPAAVEHEGRHTRTPAFIVRAVMPRLLDALRRGRFVLLVGESTAGKSRAAYEAIRQLLPDHRLIEPVSRQAGQIAVDTAIDTPKCVVWLDDLERFLGEGGLTGQGISGILAVGGGGRYVVATMRAEEYAKFSGRTGPGAINPGREALRQGWDVLRLATRVEISRTWSKADLVAAERYRDDRRIEQALRHADRFGVAEYLAAGPYLLADWRDAWAPGSHPRGAALVRAATDARRVGIHRPLPLSVLVELHEPYLRDRGGPLLRPESLEDALRWAVTPLHATSSLLLPEVEDGYLAFDYLIDAVEKTPVPRKAFDVLIAFATPGEAMELGEIAWQWLRHDQAEAAFSAAQRAGLQDGMERRCDLLRDSDGASVALEFARRAAESLERTLGPHHSETLDARRMYAWEIGMEGDPGESLRLCTELLAETVQIFGEDHQRTLKARRAVANWTGQAGDAARAAVLYAELAADCAHLLGQDAQMTVNSRMEVAHWTGEAGDPAEAILLMEELLRTVTRSDGFAQDLIFSIQFRIADRLTRTERYAEALDRWELLAADATSQFGPLHNWTLDAREDLAQCVGQAGHAQRAVELLTEVLADAAQLDAPRSRSMLMLGRTLAHWVGEAGDPTQAVVRLEGLIAISAEEFGADDPTTLGLRLRRAHWVGKTAGPVIAIEELRRLLDHATETRGPNARVTRAIREELDVWTHGC
ncbi:tetratricopeptide repeat protein [Nonomuraea solani]|uniref:tetratricopeptide repeat protein n=1 Tax=Nonomuraea solani TaxID=1144553 RepID=UPI000CDE9E9F|nr:tetratricopeptide repeat protein [Nonomuraea solani]